MKQSISILQFSLFLLILSCNVEKVAPVINDISIIPEPAELTFGNEVFTFNSNTAFVTTNQNQKQLYELLARKFVVAAGFKPAIVSSLPKSNYIIFKEDEEIEKESYKLKVTKTFVEIKASGNAGYLYGIQTLRLLLPPEIENPQRQPNTKWIIPTLEIHDYPRFPWRGLMLDVSRHFFDKDYILNTLDRMAIFKLNTLHLHLVDDQGWRIEIKKYPKLTEVGAFRVDQEEKHWDARNKNEADQKATYGGFYTQEDIKEIVQYAALLNIEVVPEIEMPAHVMSALAAYPEFSCIGEPITIPSGGVWPITDIYCPGKEETFTFLENVLEEIMELFPSKYIHVGGDEATRTNWKKCPHCQKRMKSEGLENTAELQSYFIKRMERFISSKDRVLMGWDEILEGGLAPGATVMSWRGFKGGIEASEQGHDVVMTPGDYVYFNQYQGNPDYEPIAFGGYVPLSKVYEFDPIQESMNSEQKKHILGGQANLWSEFISDQKQSEYMLFPRLAALSEVIWTPKNKQNWAAFAKKIPILFRRFDNMGIVYSKSSYAVTMESNLNKDGSIQAALKNEFPDSDIRYAINDEKLNIDSKLFVDPIKLSQTTQIKAAVFNNSTMVGEPLNKVINFHKAIGRQVSYRPVFSKQYQGTGENNLVNVLRGSKNFHDGQWQAWLEEDAEITINLQELTVVSSVLIGSMENQGSGIYYPSRIEVAVSKNGKDFTELGEISHPFESNGFVTLKDFKVSFEPVKAQWIKLKITNLSHPPTGGSAWMFFDEIVVD